MESIPFVIDQSPYAFWDRNLHDKNLEFLRGIDSRYFEYVAESNVERLDGDDKHRAALSIRLAYSQSLETLFALLGAMVQSPTCPLGWILSYRQELTEVVRKISKGESLLSSMNTKSITWHHLARVVHADRGFDENKRNWIEQGFGDCWDVFARDFVDKTFIAEHNSIKHGLRTRLGGFHLSAGIEEAPGIPATPEAMQYMGGSDFGTSFFVREKVGANNLNFRPRRWSRNWNPENLRNAVGIAAMSINNAVSALRIVNGDPPEQCEFRTPDSPDAFKKPWVHLVGVTEMNMDTVIREEDIAPMTKDEIRASYSAVDDS